MTVRRFRPRDLGRVLEIEDAAFPFDPYPEEMFTGLARECAELFLVAWDQARIIGYVTTCLKDGKAEVVSIAVDPRCRRRGVGAALLRSTLARLKRRGVPQVWLMVRQNNAAARRFYERFGFRRIRRVPGYYPNGEDAFRMRLLLQSAPAASGTK